MWELHGALDFQLNAPDTNRYASTTTHIPPKFKRPWHRWNELNALAWIFGGSREKPLKPDETMHETAWQACETDETGVKLIKK